MSVPAARRTATRRRRAGVCTGMGMGVTFTPRGAGAGGSWDTVPQIGYNQMKGAVPASPAELAPTGEPALWEPALLAMRGRACPVGASSAGDARAGVKGT